MNEKSQFEIYGYGVSLICFTIYFTLVGDPAMEETRIGALVVGGVFLVITSLYLIIKIMMRRSTNR